MLFPSTGRTFQDYVPYKTAGGLSMVHGEAMFNTSPS